MTDVLDSHPLPVSSQPPRRWRIFRWMILLPIVIAALPAGYFGLQIYRANWGIVVPGQIYRSAQMSPLLMRQKLENNHISEIIFLSHDDDQESDVRAEKRIAAQDNIQFLNFPMNGDGVATPDMYARALIALCDANRSGKTVLVHCHSGAQRTGGVIAVYRMLVQKMPAQDALAELRHYGHDPRKNLTLIPFLNEHIGQWAQALVQDGVIDRVPDPLPKLIPD